MDSIKRFTLKELTAITNHRSGEVKIGEKINLIPDSEDIVEFIKNSKANFVLFGIPEDIGVKANFGKTGTANAFKSFLHSFLNMQHNKFCKGSDIILLGELNVDDEIGFAEELDENIIDDRKKLNKLVHSIDKEVSHVMHLIIAAGKTPIVVGGGHNNAYGNIKGLALAKGKAVNVINFDAHTDFRALEGRHSGNGFSYAFEEGFIKKYFIFGLHESYTSKGILQNLKELEKQIQYISYDDIAVKNKISYKAAIDKANQFISQDYYGVEIDLDAIQNIESSAMTPSGFSVQQARQFIYAIGQNKKSSYLHICEGFSANEVKQKANQTGKLIAYFITDFIKSKSEKN